MELSNIQKCCPDVSKLTTLHRQTVKSSKLANLNDILHPLQEIGQVKMLLDYGCD